MVNESSDSVTVYATPETPRNAIVEGVAQTFDSVRDFMPEKGESNTAAAELEKRGFQVERVSHIVRATAHSNVLKNSFGVELVSVRELIEDLGIIEGVDSVPEGFELPDMLVPHPTSQASLLDHPADGISGLIFPQPLVLHAAAPNPPRPAYHHLKVPDDIVRLMNAQPLHNAGVFGDGIRAAMIDSGFHWSHPYFRGRSYKTRVALQPPTNVQDANGHGTGESANLLAIAPGVELFGLSMHDIIEAFEVTRELGVQIVSNSWGTRLPTDGPGAFWDPYWVLVEQEIALTALEGTIVLFSGGNGGRSFTASHRDTISVGGVYADPAENLEASDYASSFDSTRYPGEHVPHACGLVGMKPKAIYITLPVPEGSPIDTGLSGTPFPTKDGTAPDDGWAVFSGTSAACPQAAGVVALMLEKHPGLSLTDVRTRLEKATDVTTGQSAMGDPAAAGFDPATGHGLIDADLACK